MSDRALRVLSLQPWYGGSHRQFADGWVGHSKHDWTTVGLPAKNWKWRMKHASIDLANAVNQRVSGGEAWDVIFCTDMMNAAEFRGLCHGIQDVPLLIYFHENQFVYPSRGKNQPDNHFLFNNLTTALAADEIWFNSAFNRDSMLKAVSAHAAAWPDFELDKVCETICTKSKIVPPPIRLPESSSKSTTEERRQRITSGQPLHLLWAARWEYDKNPEDLLKCLELLHQQRVPFRLSVIGEQTEHSPAAFETIKQKFELQIEYWGFRETRAEYWSVLESADIFLSTANHEFFGLSAVEAISSGCWPLLPNRLAYPEVLQVSTRSERRDLFLYQSTPKDLATKIRNLNNNRNWNFEAAISLTSMVRSELCFARCARQMDQMLLELV